ncbi:MAG: heavy metal-associated domain-containing protein [Methylotenera sp.]|nr:heavy metal-associated domain-containing protein [Methylotenera sp.]
MITSSHLTEQATVTKRIEIPVIGMKCGGCALQIQQALSELKGVLRATVSHAEAKAYIRYAPGQVTVQQISEAILKAGYQTGEPVSTNNTTQPQQEQIKQSCCCGTK